ncbi:hypothetical protein [Amycolatopsis sp. YIM 10]|uniref:hypothetical protein n=1 Tax=Amycolatopsis sp. YIM 10 TaxID=2653857 RepID=UPI0012A94595|nr:hypothetical protein [Amycolatopsis sp. YIM 10]QFU94425.1 hypothetical protein YIM_46495 [Amycolatopsis sp. YIM 10]
MTYPPQPGQPYGQQPDPYGQGQGQGGYPQSGGFQQPGQQPGYDQYGQQQQQYPGYDQYGQQQQQGYDPNQQYQGYPQQGGYGTPPPKKGKTGLWIGLTIGVVVLVALGITGFVAPGFFLGDDKEGPEGTTNAIVAALNTQDRTAMQGLICADADETVKQVPDNLNELSAAKLVSGPTKKSDTEYTATVEVTEKKDGDTSQFDGTLVQAGDKWCWKGLGNASNTGSGKSSSKPSSGPKSSSPKGSSKPSSAPSGKTDGKAVIDEFISKVNSGDKSGALSMACSSTASLLETTVGYAIDGQGSYTVASAPPDETLVSADITGTESGRSVSGSVSATNFDDAGFCISTFYAF